MLSRSEATYSSVRVLGFCFIGFLVYGLVKWEGAAERSALGIPPRFLDGIIHGRALCGRFVLRLAHALRTRALGAAGNFAAPISRSGGRAGARAAAGAAALRTAP